MPRDRVLTVAGAVLAVVVSLVLFTRFGIHGNLSRDEAIYVYGGQQMAHGVAPYASIFDPKGPLATVLAGVAALVARLTGRDSVAVIRLAYLVCSCLTVLAVYLLALRIWRTRLAALSAAIVFASFHGFAADALSGPDAKTPGILFAVLSMWLLAGRQWFWAALTGSLAVLVWQPLLFYPATVVAVAVLASTARDRWRSLGMVVVGGAIPVVLTVVYFVTAAAWSEFVESAIVYPLSGVERADESVPGRILRIIRVVSSYYGFSALLFWLGLLLLGVLMVMHLIRHRSDLFRAVRSPLICIVGVTLAGEVAYATVDFQSAPDLYPLLVYPALGVGGAVAAVAARVKGARQQQVATGVAFVLMAGVVVASGVSFASDDNSNPDTLRAQQVNGCALQRILTPGSPLYSLGDPVPLVITNRRNPDRFIFLESGVDDWKIDHTRGGFDGWTAQIQAAHPSAVVVNGWEGETTLKMHEWLRNNGYRRAFVGPWRTFVDPAVDARARRKGIDLPRKATPVVTDRSGQELTTTPCVRRGG